MGLKDYESTKRRLIEAGYLDERLLHPDEMFSAIHKALDHAIIGRAALDAPAPRAVAETFLRDTVQNKDTSFSERMHAAALLLQVKP